MKKIITAMLFFAFFSTVNAQSLNVNVNLGDKKDEKKTEKVIIKEKETVIIKDEKEKKDRGKHKGQYKKKDKKEKKEKKDKE